MKLEELQRLAEGATPGPWFTDQHGLSVYVGDYAVASLMTKSGAHRNHEANAAYIVALENSAKKLIAALLLAKEAMKGANREAWDAFRTALEELK